MVNQCKTSHIAKLVYKEFNSIVERNLRIELLPFGLIYQDGTMEQAVQQQKILLSVYPKARA
ncbi:MAG: MinD/ParA family ATP-binding protein [Thermodesulfobacteriota bacterium]